MPVGNPMLNQQWEFFSTQAYFPGRNAYTDDFYGRSDGMCYDLEKFNYQSPAVHGNDWAHWYWPRTEHQMTWNKRFVDKKNALIKNKPVVDCSLPINHISREDQVRRQGTNWGIWGITSSLAHFHQEPEIVSYTDSYSTRDTIMMWAGVINMAAPQMWVGKYLMAGGQEPANPRTFWAHKITWVCRFLRLQAAIAVGIGGCFLSYEFCYTYVPYLRIRDPSPEGWKKNWQTGQSTWLARGVSCLFPMLGMYIYHGHGRKANYYLLYTVAFFAHWEFYRGHATNNGLQWKQNGMIQEAQEKNWGSLMPTSKRNGDRDSEMPLSPMSYKYHRRFEQQQRPDTGSNSDAMNFYDMPFHQTTLVWKNERFNWSKAGQTWRDAPYRCANDTWEEPDPVTANVLAGQYWDRENGTHNYGFNPRGYQGASYTRQCQTE